MGPVHALASWFVAAFGQTSNDLGVSRPTQRQQQHHLMAVGPPYTGIAWNDRISKCNTQGRIWHCLFVDSGEETNDAAISSVHTHWCCVKDVQHLACKHAAPTALAQ